MNKQLLHQYLMFLLSDEKIAILQLKATADIMNALVASLMQAAALLPFYYATEVLERLKALAQGYPELSGSIDDVLKKKINAARWQKLFPWLALLITLLLCVAMYFFGKM